MKEGIHPKLVKATVICACGNTWETLSTKEVLKTDLCSNCHPFYTGEQRIVDTAGQVERFMRRMNARNEQAARSVEVARRASKNKANVAPPPQERRPSASTAEGEDTETDESAVAVATLEPGTTEE
jgi:large subunit ribosomal protein L31